MLRQCCAWLVGVVEALSSLKRPVWATRLVVSLFSAHRKAVLICAAAASRCVGQSRLARQRKDS